jgi:hypothetical protein
LNHATEGTARAAETYPAELLVESAANVLVNSAKNEGPQLPEPAA